MKLIPKLLTASALALVTSQASAAVINATISGSGSLTAQPGTSEYVNSTYEYSGTGTGASGSYDGTIIQEITSLLGIAVISSDVLFDTSGVGTSTVTGCTGPSLICAAANAVIGIPSAYATGPQTPTASGFSYDQNFVVPTDFGPADSASTINVNYVPVPAAAWLFGSALLGLAGIKRRKQA